MKSAPSPVIVVAHAGEPLDGAVWRAIGRTAGTVEQLLDTTPGLAARSLALAGGEILTLPVQSDTPAAVDLVQLWD